MMVSDTGCCSFAMAVDVLGLGRARRAAAHARTASITERLAASLAEATSAS
jgi:hypothetical protein